MTLRTEILSILSDFLKQIIFSQVINSVLVVVSCMHSISSLYNSMCNQTNPYSFKYSLSTVKILKFGTPQTIAITVLEIEKFDVTLH